MNDYWVTRINERYKAQTGPYREITHIAAEMLAEMQAKIDENTDKPAQVGQKYRPTTEHDAEDALREFNRVKEIAPCSTCAMWTALNFIGAVVPAQDGQKDAELMMIYEFRAFIAGYFGKRSIDTYALWDAIDARWPLPKGAVVPAQDGGV